jgi:hypothetical protein
MTRRDRRPRSCRKFRKSAQRLRTFAETATGRVTSRRLNATARNGLIAIGGIDIAKPSSSLTQDITTSMPAGHWYPAYGYNPAYDYYDYDGPIYTYGNLLPDQVIANVQRALQEAGYYAGPITGSIGSGTRAALGYFQRDYVLIITEAIVEPTVAALGLIVFRPRPPPRPRSFFRVWGTRTRTRTIPKQGTLNSEGIRPPRRAG